MTAYGLALLLTMMIKKGMTPFLFIGSCSPPTSTCPSSRSL